MSPILFQFAKYFCIFMFSSIFTRIMITFLKGSRPRSIYKEREPIQINTLEKAVTYVLRHNNIQNRLELQEWCGGKSRKLFYNEVRKVAPFLWQITPDPKKYVRDLYQCILPGYINSRAM